MSDEGVPPHDPWANPKAVLAKFNEAACEIGHVTMAWSHLHEQLAVLFCNVTGLNEAVGLAIWHSQPSDRNQRAMLLAAIKKTNAPPLPHDRAKADLEWLLSRVDAAANTRNDSIHVPTAVTITSSGARVAAFAMHGNPRAQKTRDDDQLKVLGHLKRTLHALYQFARELANALDPEIPQPWPKRPLLPTLEHQKKQPSRSEQ